MVNLLIIINKKNHYNYNHSKVAKLIKDKNWSHIKFESVLKEDINNKL